MKRRSGGGGGGEGSWLNTYADMVTLLLCFFVLLYAISSVDKVKWEILVKSLNPNYAREVSQIVTNVDSKDGEFDVEGSMDRPAEDAIQNFDDLYYTLVQAAEAMGLGNDVQIQKSDDSSSAQGKDTSSSSASSAASAMGAGASAAFITFQDRVFFRGDDSALTDKGKEILKQFSKILGRANHLIGEVDVLGHTSQGDPKRPNNIRTDYTLSALRSMEVIVYLAQQKDIDTNKFVGEFFGQHKSIAKFDTAENRSKNRRVEILILKKGSELDTILDKYYEKFYKGDIRNSGFDLPKQDKTKKEDKATDKKDGVKTEDEDTGTTDTVDNASFTNNEVKTDDNQTDTTATDNTRPTDSTEDTTQNQGNNTDTSTENTP